MKTFSRSASRLSAQAGFGSQSGKANVLIMMVVSVALGSLSGCATTRDTHKLVQSASTVATERFEAARAPISPPSNFVVDNNFYVSRTPIDTPAPNASVRLPEAFKKDASTNRLLPTTLTELAQNITKMSGYRVVIAPDVAASGNVTLQEILFKGNLSGLLDYISGNLGISWRWTGDTIELYRYETKMFRIMALAGTTDVTTKLDTAASNASSGGGGGGGGSSGGGIQGNSGQTTSISSNFDVWTDITASIKSVLSPGGSINVAPSAGLITVRDTPNVLSEVEAQVREFNHVYSRQVKLDVEVYAVERNASDAVGMDWTVAWQQATKKYGINFSSGGAGTVGNNVPSFSGVINNGPFAGSGLLLQALSSLGHTTLLTSGTVNSLNGQSVPLNVSREKAYLQSYSTTLTSGTSGTSTTTLTPGVITDGFSMHFTPRILENNKVLIRYSVDLSSIDSIDTFASPDGMSAIQLPSRSSRNFLQNVSVRSGQTVVLTGFQQAGGNNDQSGPFSPHLWALGGKTKADNVTRTIVVVVTPIVIE